MVNISHLSTENRNCASMDLDQLSSVDIVKLMNKEDSKVISAINKETENIAKIIDLGVQTIRKKGRIIYVGAGTSGRLGILDAVECQPTFSTKDEFIGLIAGGDKAFIKAQENVEDSIDKAVEDLKNINLNEKDLLISITASGRTPYCISALEYANLKSIKTASISCNKNSEVSKFADEFVEVDCGPEVLTGSTRLKAGSAQKMILNMISTGVMSQTGRVYKNLMIDVKVTNAKLRERLIQIVMAATEVDYDTALKALKSSDYNAKQAVVMIALKCDFATACKMLDKNNDNISECLEEIANG